ncbi:Hint domain-containing protein [Celeribacter persicus]|uniref:Hint domain-containing protein n=1 Tax=Celeribacter persicus TaxID=1651082 RepID=A0A2T5HLW6_9RHOB|nr:Hint domain-containing protein [Celeribacter persicus]PTQ72536.1 Hint domain-containing protein [Celeribacter persicus]
MYNVTVSRHNEASVAAGRIVRVFVPGPSQITPAKGSFLRKVSGKGMKAGIGDHMQAQFQGQMGLPVQSLAVYRAGALRVTNGVNLGEALSNATELELADAYHLRKHANRGRLSVNVNGDKLSVSKGTELGAEGHDLHLDCIATFMAGSGNTIEVLVLVETDANGLIEDTFFLPFAPLQPDVEYVLVKVDEDTARTRLADVACVAFTRGTRITLANGIQKPIEDLAVGDRVLTRDHGPQEVRWIGSQTVRATGAFAPIVIREGALNNAHDLVVSPNHRIFIYQRHDAVRAGRAEVLVKAKLLVNGQNVIQAEGGFVDYFQLLFDTHEIIYAEGIAAESMFVDGRVKPFLPEDVQARIASEHVYAETPRAFELRDGMLEPSVAAEVLRSASGN